MIEAMACGTPVIAFNRGSVPEVVGKDTGDVVDTFDEMLQSISNLNHFNRPGCRAEAYRKFNINKIAKNYLNLYK